jgi:hypothetical protein
MDDLMSVVKRRFDRFATSRYWVGSQRALLAAHSIGLYSVRRLAVVTSPRSRIWFQMPPERLRRVAQYCRTCAQNLGKFRLSSSVAESHRIARQDFGHFFDGVWGMGLRTAG